MTRMSVAVPLHEIRAEFAELDDPNDWMTYLVEIGQTLPPLAPHLKTEENRVLGCQSMVWMVAEQVPGDPPTLDFTADSDAPMVRGLIAILLRLFSGRRPDEIVAFDPKTAFETLGLSGALSSQRSNGLAAMAARIRRDAEALAAA